ncbi:type II toxin-antitoxin system prevent-host-death family antitoxin [Streptosporangium canum]|uniref:type II toxin-antitoxin system prevent-host-death family antitoxin n=1 Tax=Streptosporangium canum TaxID=324952 RepID=UPI003412C587
MDRADTTVDSSELEVGLRDARASLGELVDKVAYGELTVFLTKNGRRMAAIKKVDASTGDTKKPTEDSAQLSIPGNVEAAATIIDAMLVDREDYNPNLARFKGIEKSDLIGGIATLIYYLIPGREVIAEVEREEDREEIDATLARLALAVSRRLLSGGVSVTPASTIAGAIMAAHCGQHPAEWRNTFAVAVTDAEADAWIYGCWGLADLVNKLMGEGVAENVLYSTVEHIDELEHERGLHEED